MEEVSSVLSVGQLQEVIKSGALTTTLTVQILGKAFKLTEDGKKFVEVTISDSVTTAVVQLGPKIKLSSADSRKLKSYNIMDIKRLSILTNPTLIILLEFDNIREYTKKLGEVAPSSNQSQLPSNSRTAPKRPKMPFNVVASSIDRRFIDIGLLNDVTAKLGHWIRAKVVSKQNLRSVKWSDRYGDILDFVIADHTLDIKVSAWNQNAAKVNALLKEGAGYLFHGYTVRAITSYTRQYNDTKHNYEMSLADNCLVLEDADASNIEIALPVYTSISEIPNFDDKNLLNLRGVILRMTDRELVRVRDRKVLVREISIVDMSSYKIDITLWDELAGQSLERGEGYTFQHFAVGRDNGLQMSSVASSRIRKDENLDIRKWYDNLGRTMKVKSVKLLFDKQMHGKTATCFDLLSAMEIPHDETCYSNNETARKINEPTTYTGIFRVITHEPVRIYCKCSTCGRNLQVPDLSVKHVECVCSPKYAGPPHFQYSTTITIADHTAHCQVSAYSNGLRSLDIILDTDIAKNIQLIDSALKKISFIPCQLVIKIDGNRSTPRRATLTSIMICPQEFLRHHCDVLLHKDLPDCDRRAIVYTNYWKNVANHATYPVMVTDVMGDDVDDIFTRIKHRSLVFVTTLSGVSYEDDTKMLTFGMVGNPNGLFLSFVDSLDQFDVDENNVGELVEVFITMSYGVHGEVVFNLTAVRVVDEEYSRDFDKIRMSEQEFFKKLDACYSYTPTNCGYNDAGASREVNLTLSPRFGGVGLHDEPPSKRPKY